MKCAPVRCASARLRFHCEMSRALSNEMMTTCLGFAGVGGAGGSAKATPAVASEARENATARNGRYIGNLILTSEDVWKPAIAQMWRGCDWPFGRPAVGIGDFPAEPLPCRQNFAKTRADNGPRGQEWFD